MGTGDLMKLGNITRVEINLTGPIPFKFEGEVKQLNIYVGQNATGKSLLLKLTWMMGTLASACVSNGMASFSPEEKAQYLLTHTFLAPEEFDGKLIFYYENGLVGLIVE